MQHAAYGVVPCICPFLIFTVRNDRRIARMTGQLEQPESRNVRKARTTGKPERPESQNDRKARTKGIAGTVGKIGTMNPAPLGEADRFRCVNSSKLIFLRFLGSAHIAY